MGMSTWLLLLATHPLEFRTLLQYYIYHYQKRDITAKHEHATSGWDRPSMRRCWELLDLTSRSYSSVIKEPEGDLARLVCLFYLVLRGLDTVEDDMTLPLSVKDPLLRNFHKHSLTPGFCFIGSGPDEKDRQLLLEYYVVIEELGSLPEAYRNAILSIAEKMGAGMADFCARAETEKGAAGLETIADYDLYCHYVAGLVGEGLSLLFSASGRESPDLGAQLELSNSMGLLLQKTNITRDFREDVDQRRYFWPREIWAGAQYGGAFESMEEMCTPPPGTVSLPGVRERAAWVQSAMVLDALRHATDSLDYLRMLKNQSVFNFCAIPVTMAMATLELCFMNPRMFATHIKIRKATAASLIMRSKNPREVSLIFREYARKIHAKALPSDPNFIRISVACGKIEQWCERYYPSFVLLNTGGAVAQSIDPTDARGRTYLADQKRDDLRAKQMRLAEIRAGIATNGARVPAGQERSGGVQELLLYAGGALLLVVGVLAAVIYFILQISD
ncbi:farnesyl-diphosphate farnesyltransferase [Mycena maculata]|uniref:Squalene synthase n=1 Tax=Mycena maculata TaxID=230809 RepID=A0AAD7I8C5_9AGAR|nr:farnesyl-diphosphate farnesyltransferase [Mycena maculata]